MVCFCTSTVSQSLLWEWNLLGNIPVDVWECSLTLSALAMYTHVHIHIHKLSFLQEHSEDRVQNNSVLYVCILRFPDWLSTKMCNSFLYAQDFLCCGIQGSGHTKLWDYQRAVFLGWIVLFQSHCMKTSCASVSQFQIYMENQN